MIIITSPYDEPTQHLEYNYNSKCYEIVNGRRCAGYMRTTQTKKIDGLFGNVEEFIEIKNVDKIRQEVKKWRSNGYVNATPITRRLLEYWNNTEDRSREKRFFFCQLEAIETLIWLHEIYPHMDKSSIKIVGDGGKFERLCSKMATGTGKTVVMAMLIAWQTINSLHDINDTRFTRYFLLVAPSLVVRDRLEVLQPTNNFNYYKEFDVVPDRLWSELTRARILINNWHGLSWESAEEIKKRKRVDKRGVKSDYAYADEVLSEIAHAKSIIVINDEAHHAYRIPEHNSKISGVSSENKKLATQWINGLDRIHRISGIKKCYDFSATPYIPSTNSDADNFLFNWIVSDFSLSDAIEAGLVKTPRMVVRDDAIPNKLTNRSSLYHLFNEEEVNVDLNRKNAEDNDPIPDLVRVGYKLLLDDWGKTHKLWKKMNSPTPPTMITVTNKTITARRIYNAFVKGDITSDMNAATVLRIDSQAEKEIYENNQASTEITTLREMVRTIGKAGEMGEKIRHVISVDMLTEGWDAKTVTHIMGLRAFKSQLLCEQVIGRGLRRATYEIGTDMLLTEETVNIFGVPFAFIPQDNDGLSPPPPLARVRMYTVDERENKYSITIPDVLQINRIIQPDFIVDWLKIKPFIINRNEIRSVAETEKILIDGNIIPDLDSNEGRAITINSNNHRIQTTFFRIARHLARTLKFDHEVPRAFLFVKLVKLIDTMISLKLLRIDPPSLFDNLRPEQVFDSFTSQISMYLNEAIKLTNITKRTIRLSRKRIISTSDFKERYTTKQTKPTKKSHINVVVLDSTWERDVASILDKTPCVISWVKNEKWLLKIEYIFQYKRKYYVPDFIIKVMTKAGFINHLVLEVKGREDNTTRHKEMALREWVDAVNDNGSFGYWTAAQITSVKDVHKILEETTKFS